MTNAKCKLLFYVPSLGDGGGERLWAALATAFFQAGHQVIVAQDFDAEESRHILDPHIPVHTLGRSHVSSVRALTKLLQQSRPAVALSAIAGSNLKLLCARYLSGSGTAIVQSFHGHNEWRTGWLSYLTARALPITSRLAMRTIAVSEPLRDELIAAWRSAASTTITVPNPVLLPDRIDVPTAQQVAQRPPVVLAIGRLSKDKDFLTLVKAFAALDRSDTRLVIVGKGPQEDALRALINDLGISEQVYFEGYVSEPWPYYQKAKCLALSSPSEAFGNVIVEALAFGIPVVAADTGGPQQILTHPEFGTRVPPGDVLAMANALEKYLDAPGDPGPRSRHASGYALANRIQVYETLIEEILSSRPASATEGTLFNTGDA